jgi:transcriptional regulator with XRE-family HTH domain
MKKYSPAIKIGPIYKELGVYLRNKRMKAQLSQTEVSEALGYTSPQFVSNFERGLCSPPLPKLKVLMSLYKIPLREMTEKLIDQQRRYLSQELSGSKKKRRAS